MLLECKNDEIAKSRKKYIPEFERFYICPSMLTCINLLKCKDVDVSRKLG